VIYGEDLPVGVIGVSDLIIVASREGVLVCDRRRDQETRQIARMIEQAKPAGASGVASSGGRPADRSACGSSSRRKKSS
jgi:hypothetical protein